jgi:hypothetical protein
MSEFNIKRFFVIEIWNIKLTLPQQTWTLDKLNQQFKEFYKLAKNYGCYIERNRTMIPDYAINKLL